MVIQEQKKGNAMIKNSTQKKINNIFLSLLVMAGIYAISALCFDFYYDLNDDMAIKDILAGAYAGVPDGHNNQMLYPISFMLACLYSIFPKLPIFGFFLCACFGTCFAMISYRIQGFFQDVRIKIITVILMIFVIFSLMWWEIVYVQYSVVCGVLAGTACFWFYTTPTELGIGEFWEKNILALFLVWLAFNIRSEMLLLTSPFIAVVGIWHWTDSAMVEKESTIDIDKKALWKHAFSKENIYKYIGFVVAMLFGLGLSILGDSLAYNSAEWQEYRRFFDARTEVYDYTWYPDYEEQKNFYEENGISSIQYRLIDNYNFGLDETINENTLKIVASYGERPRLFGSMFYRIKSALLEIITRFFSLTDAPYNYFVMGGYSLVIGLSIVQKNKEYIWKLFLLGVMRCVPWFYLIYVQRAVDRITHPLYVIEFLLLLALLIKEFYDRPLWNVEKYYRIVGAGVLATIAIISLPFVFDKVKKEQIQREYCLIKYDSWIDYVKEHPDNYYYLDVYSTFSFTEKIYENVDNSQKNYDYLGGWICHSPLQEKAREKYANLSFRENNMEETDFVSHSEEIFRDSTTTIADILLTDNFYFVAESNRDVTFMEDFYKSNRKQVKLELQDTISEKDNPFMVYKIVEQKIP